MLYVPHKLLERPDDRGQYTAADYPAQDAIPKAGRPSPFPFVFPPVYDARAGEFGTMDFAELRAVLLLGSPLRTRPSTTKVASSVTAVAGLLGFELIIKHCPTFVDHLRRYAFAEHQHEKELSPSDRAYPTLHMRSSWSSDRTIGMACLPSERMQAAALRHLAAQYVVQIDRRPAVVNSERSVHNEVNDQLLAIMNTWMRVSLLRSPATLYISLTNVFLDSVQ